ncbi:Carbonic anhydrase 1 [Maioricimonas rarisocia]|uniref:Carbonic anhydrase n=1 Tax=Maioricimonas rarisocia TaxID=2528026 RepID=A0A517Z0Z4_9PLAN|nr:carbonic anhydrase [Maioricimonas rarisocia]QDU36150.1 Carbonic anhydrase 1 [Maioricimonas rarisocia]
MQQLVNGIRQFQNTISEEQKALFSRLSDGQQPGALFITCSDSRVCPNLLTQTQPGELFVLRTAGNIVPPYGAVQGGEAATIEYAVAALKVPDIVVCGHAKCGAMDALMKGEGLDQVPAVQAYLRHAEATRRIMSETSGEVDDPARRLELAIEQNVLVQLENLRTHPAVAAAIARGDVRLHGWVYHFHTGDVTAYSAGHKRFVPLAEAASSAVASEVAVN